MLKFLEMGNTAVGVFLVTGVLFIIGLVFVSLKNRQAYTVVHSRMPVPHHVRRNGFGKWIAGGLGWVFFGPIGGIIGFVLGRLFENSSKEESYRTIGETEPQRDFNVSLLVLSAAVMKADGKVLKSELNYVKQFFLRNFGQERAENYIRMLREILQQDFNIYDVSRQVGQYMDYSSKLQLLHYLFGIAQANGVVSDSEVGVINTISDYMGITNADFQSIKAMFVKKTDSAYKILGVDENATDEEVKKAFREMAKKNHPDRVGSLGEDVRKAAEKKFQEINAAYEQIKKQRGMN